MTRIACEVVEDGGDLVDFRCCCVRYRGGVLADTITGSYHTRKSPHMLT